MILEYHRPKTLEDALQLLARSEPVTVPLAGGSSLNRPSAEAVAAVDLQLLGLNTLQPRGNFIDLGATLSLQALLESDGNGFALQPALKEAILHEATYNLRQVATVAGTLVAAGGTSPFTTALLALDAGLQLAPGEESLALGDLLPFRPAKLKGRLITQVTIPLNARLAYAYVARTPADWPLVCAAAAAWPSGRVRVTLGGWGAAPALVMDGPEPGGAEDAARSAAAEAGDQWASAEYRQETAVTLVQRCVQAVRSE